MAKNDAKWQRKQETTKAWYDRQKEIQAFKLRLIEEYNTRDTQEFHVRIKTPLYGDISIIFDRIDFKTFISYNWYFGKMNHYDKTMLAPVPADIIKNLFPEAPQKTYCPVRGTRTSMSFQAIIMKTLRGRSICFKNMDTLDFRRENLIYRPSYLKFVHGIGLSQDEINRKLTFPPALNCEQYLKLCK